VSLSRKARNSALGAVLLLLGTACRTAAPIAPAAVPDPLAPPLPGPALTTAQERSARSAAAAASRADVEGARKKLAKLPQAHPVGRLILLEARFVRGDRIAAEALELAAAAPEYAAAWQVAVAALEREDRVEEALAAGRRLLPLRGDDASRRLVTRLEGEVVVDGVREASTLLGRGDAAAALSRAHRVLELVPTSDDARIVAVRAALASGQTASAVALLPALPDSPAGLEVKGRTAEALGQWELAADLYGQLPEGYPARCELLAGAREQVRFSLAPPYLERALDEAAVTRRGLAAILSWEVPGLSEKAAGAVPVFEDVVGLPEGRDIVIAVRAGVLVGDSIARRFGPRRTVTERELLSCLTRLAAVVGTAPPSWCGQEDSTRECLARPATLDGRTVAALVRSVAGQEGIPCTPR
jgi:tetratricopeptide (TPR) repeat protein